MLMKCPACGTENWLESQSQCVHCWAVLRRCADCSNYDRAHTTCRSINDRIDPYEAEHPSGLGSSTNCQSYRMVGKAA